jgi:hypothetical protein
MERNEIIAYTPTWKEWKMGRLDVIRLNGLHHILLHSSEILQIQTIEHKYLPLYSILYHKSKHRQKIKMKVDIFKSI